MASLYKLPSFKVTQKVRGGRTVHRTVPRGGVIQDAHDRDSSTSKADAVMEDGDDQPTEVIESTVDVDHVGADISLHAIREQASARAWQEIRPQLLRAAVEASAMPQTQVCIMCTERALYRCCECGSNAYYCQECFKKAHSKVNVFHVGEIWQVKYPHCI